MIRGGKSYIYLTDNNGSVTGISGSCDCSHATYAYTPYGALASKSAGSGGSLVTQNLIGYTGALTDTFTAGSTGYVHDGARWYNPQTGRFAGQDGNSYLGNPANGNRYAYAADNPVNYTDPTGNISWDKFWTGVGFFSATVLGTAAAVAFSEISLPAILLGAALGGGASVYFITSGLTS